MEVEPSKHRPNSTHDAKQKQEKKKKISIQIEDLKKSHYKIFFILLRMVI